jgi:hypothetical protein
MDVFLKRYGCFPKKIWMFSQKDMDVFLKRYGCFLGTFPNSVKLQRNRPVKTGLQLNDQQATN